ncbi:hypothetical protein Taro_048045 [Colocasia esculenta]|uniref:Uncharacterized protein n=1 Tax=Colocasia esculenta TaxID=4460 RepID=A0A843X4Q1_COLES|nr:hypothetical protein [Colocasia esculenta]
MRKGVSSRPQHPRVPQYFLPTTCGQRRVYARPSAGNADPSTDLGDTAGSAAGSGSGSSSSSSRAWPWWSVHYGEVQEDGSAFF